MNEEFGFPLERRVFSEDVSGEERSYLILSPKGKTEQFVIELFKEDQIKNSTKDYDVSYTKDEYDKRQIKRKWVKLDGGDNQKVYADISSISNLLKCKQDYITSVIRKQGVAELENQIESFIKLKLFQREVFIGNASNIGPFSGKEKSRLELIPGNKHLAIALLEEADPKEKNVSWVYLRSKEGLVRADATSLSKRLGMPKKKILEFAAEDSKYNTLLLEEKIQEYIDSYQKTLNQAPKDNQLYWKKITKSIEDVKIFIQKAFSLGENSGNEGPRLKLIDDPKLDNVNRFAIKIDGNLYNQRPESKKDYVPYKIDENRWVLLHGGSLERRLGVNFETIKEKAEADITGEILTSFINEQLNDFLNEEREFQEIFEEKRNLWEFKNDKQFKRSIFDEFLRQIRNIPNTIALDHYAKEHFWWRISHSKIISSENLSKWQNLGIFKKDSDFKLKLGNTSIIIDPVIYTEKPKSTLRSVAYQINKNYWVLLNAFDLIEKTNISTDDLNKKLELDNKNNNTKLISQVVELLNISR